MTLSPEARRRAQRRYMDQRLNRLYADHPDAKPCPVCECPVPTGSSMGNHFRCHKNETDKIICVLCGTLWDDEDALYEHKKERHPANPRRRYRDPAEIREKRWKYVQRFARRPYPEFLAAVQAPWSPDD